MDFTGWRDAYDAEFDYSLEELNMKWPDLHQWDGEPLPTEERIAVELATFGDQIASSDYRGDPVRISKVLLNGWADFHAGRFGAACSKGLNLGPIGHYLATTSASIYAFYFANASERLDLFKSAYKLAQGTVNGGYKHTNTLYMYACNLGRWGEGVSKIKALQSGTPLKFRSAILKTLEGDPGHIYARTGLAAFQGMIIGESLESVARITFGATREKCYDIFEGVIKEAPNLPLPTMQYGRSILMIEGDKKGKRGIDYIRQASAKRPRDVMEKLDATFAKSLLT